MPKTSVFEPLFDDGLASINFFNGRLLSAEDLKTDKRAAREERRRLGQAVGEGVAYGLDVREADTSSKDGPAVTVTAGLAIDRRGDTVWLPSTTDVSLLTGTASASGVRIVEAFDYCKPPQAGTYRGGAGVYLLAIRTARGAKGRAPVSGLGNEAAACNVRFLIEGVQFVLVPLPVETLFDDVGRLRNRLAYACFGVDADAALVADPAGRPASGDVVRALRDTGAITDGDVPLAVIHWTGEGTQFVDMWAVRRRPAMTTDGAVGRLQDPAQTARGEARLLQFQAQIADLVGTSASASTLDARSAFKYLPPAAFLPITGVRAEGTRLRPAATSNRRALDYERFFGNRVRAEPRVIEGARLGSLIRESFACPPIDLNGEQMFWLYVVRENMQAVERSGSEVPYMIVASPHLRFQADARIDVNEWNYSNFV